MSKPRVGVDLRALVGRPSGIGFFTLAIVRRLAQRGVVRVIGLAHDKPYRADLLEAAGVEIESRAKHLGVWWQQSYLPRRLRRGDIDLFWSPLFTLPLRLDIPGIVTVHDLATVLYPETHGLKVKLSILPFLRPSLDRAHCIVCDSKATADDVCTQFPESAAKVRIVYPGIDPEFRPAAAEAILATRQRIDCPSGYVLFVGTIEPRKNLDVMLDAWESWRRREPNALPLVVAGSYGWRSRDTLRRVEALAKNAGLVWIESPDRAAVVELFQAASALVLPSLYEGFGLPAAEAMACGVPAVVSDRSSLPEVVGDAGVTFEADDAEGLARILDRLAKDDRWAAELAELSLAASSRFDWDRAAERMEDVFTEALR